jgi:hypothetical protein
LHEVVEPLEGAGKDQAKPVKEDGLGFVRFRHVTQADRFFDAVSGLGR